MKTVPQWQVAVCPFAAECSQQAYSRAYVRSQTSESHCRKLLFMHLCRSSKHAALSKDDIFVAATRWPVEESEGHKWEHEDDRCPDVSIPHPEGEDNAYKESEDARVAAEQGGDASESALVAVDRKRGVDARLAQTLRDIVRTEMKEAEKRRDASETQLALKRPRLQHNGAAIEMMKGALAAVQRCDQAMTHTIEWLRKGQLAFEQEREHIRSAGLAVGDAIAEITGEPPFRRAAARPFETDGLFHPRPPPFAPMESSSGSGGRRHRGSWGK